MSAVRLFFGADFILSEFTDNYFEVETVLCFYFYAFGDVFRRNGIVQQNCIANTVLSLRELFRRIKTTSTIFAKAKMVNEAFSDEALFHCRSTI